MKFRHWASLCRWKSGGVHRSASRSSPSTPTSGKSDSGLLFASYQADIDRQFVPIQRNLGKGDLLNEWVTPIGSAVFAIPPGCTPEGWIGDNLLS
jgi:deferrochelatase/peroxidase EfeB